MVPGTAVITLTDDESIYSAGSSFVFSSAFGPHHGRELGIDVLSDWNALWLLDYNRSLLLQGGVGITRRDAAPTGSGRLLPAGSMARPAGNLTSVRRRWGGSGNNWSRSGLSYLAHQARRSPQGVKTRHPTARWIRFLSAGSFGEKNGPVLSSRISENCAGVTAGVRDGYGRPCSGQRKNHFPPLRPKVVFNFTKRA